MNSMSQGVHRIWWVLFSCWKTLSLCIYTYIYTYVLFRLAWLDIWVCHGPPSLLCYKPVPQALCYKPLSRASVESTAVFNRLVAGRVCSKTSRFATSLIAKRPPVPVTSPMVLSRCHVYLWSPRYDPPTIALTVNLQYVPVFLLYPNATPIWILHVLIFLVFWLPRRQKNPKNTWFVGFHQRIPPKLWEKKSLKR